MTAVRHLKINFGNRSKYAQNFATVMQTSSETVHEARKLLPVECKMADGTYGTLLATVASCGLCLRNM